MKLTRRASLKSLVAFPFLPQSLYRSSQENSGSGMSDTVVKPKISLNLYSFNDQLQSGTISLDEVISYCVQNGYSALDPTAYYFPGYPEVPVDSFLYDFKRKVFENGLEISGTGVRNDFTVSDYGKRMMDERMVENWAIAAKKMGIPVLRIFAGGEIPDPEQKKKVLSWMMDDFKRCADIGTRHGVIMALQNHGEFIKTSDEVIHIMDTVNSPWFRLHLDIANFSTMNVYDEIDRVIRYAVNWQVKEFVTIQGKQTLPDYVRIMQIIKNHGYRGYLPLETLGEGDPKKKLPELKDKVETAIQQVFG